MTITFTYDPIRKQAVTSDPGIFVERVTVTRDHTYNFALNWHRKRIVIKAKVAVTGELPSRRHDWTITGIGRINMHIPAYPFSSNAELNAAAELALKAMRVMPASLLPMEQPIITADFSPDLKVFLLRFPN